MIFAHSGAIEPAHIVPKACMGWFAQNSMVDTSVPILNRKYSISGLRSPMNYQAETVIPLFASNTQQTWPHRSTAK